MPNAKTYAVFARNSGHILQVVTMPRATIRASRATSYLEIDSEAATEGKRVDIERKQLVDKHSFAEGQWQGKEFTVTGLPKGCLAHWQGRAYTVNDGSVTVTVDQPDIHTLRLTHPLYHTRSYALEN